MPAHVTMKKVTIVCDGSSLGNGRGNPRAAAIALLGFQGLWKGVGQYLGNATNQQAEIAAAAIGLENLKERCDVTLMSDSRYVIETMGGTWKRKTNHAWWKRLDAAAQGHKIEWVWVKGHAGHDVQEVADKMARKIAELGYIDEMLLKDAVAELGVLEI
jgi:ribonuclease HI